MFSAVVNLVYNNTPGSTQLCTKTFSDSIISTLEEHHADSKVTEHMVRTIATMLFLVPPSARKLFASQRVATLLIRTLNVHQLKFSLLEQALCGLYHITLVQCVAVKLRNSEESCTILRDCIEHMVLHLQFWLCVQYRWSSLNNCFLFIYLIDCYGGIESRRWEVLYYGSASMGASSTYQHIVHGSSWS